MPSVQELLARMRTNPKGVRFVDAKRVCDNYFGKPRIHGSHHAYRTLWPGDPRVNIQNRGGMVSPYQARQMIAAVERVVNDEYQDR